MVDVIKVRPKSLSDAVGPVGDCVRIRSHIVGLAKTGYVMRRVAYVVSCGSRWLLALVTGFVG